MPFQRSGERFVNLVIILMLVGVSAPRLFPELAWLRWTWWAAWILAGGYLLVVLLDARASWGEQRKKRRLLDRLAALRDGTGDPEAIAAEADAILNELGDMFVQLPDLVATEGLVEACRTEGPHRVACLRLALRHAYLVNDTWIDVLVQGRGALEDAELAADEREKLEGLETFLKNRAARRATTSPATSDAATPTRTPPG